MASERRGHSPPESPHEEVIYMQQSIVGSLASSKRVERTALLLSLLVLALLIVCVPGQAGAVRHTLDRDREAFALWENPKTGTIAIAHILPDEHSQSLGLLKQYRDANGTVIGRTELFVEQLPIAPYGTFTMNRKLSRASLDVTGVPASCFASGRAACATSTIDAHLTWVGVGKRRNTGADTRHCVVQFGGFLFVENIVSSWSERRAVAEGRMNTTRLSEQHVEDGHLASGVTGQVYVDTKIGSTRDLIRGDCANP
jgi:hypothetical protein